MSTFGFLLVMCVIFGDQDKIYFTLISYHQNSRVFFRKTDFGMTIPSPGRQTCRRFNFCHLWLSLTHQGAVNTSMLDISGLWRPYCFCSKRSSQLYSYVKIRRVSSLNVWCTLCVTLRRFYLKTVNANLCQPILDYLSSYTWWKLPDLNT